MVKTLCEMHQLELHVESVPGQGTEISIKPLHLG
jgi:signal transduction histidine kinase